MADPENALSLRSQMDFLRSGGAYRAGVAKLPPYEYQEYPKAIRLNVREEAVEESVLDVHGRELKRTVTRTVWDEVVAEDAEMEAQIMARQPTRVDRENERQELIRDAERAGLKVDRRWTTERIRAEMEAAA